MCYINRELKTNQAQLLLNLCVALIIANVIFVAGVKRTSRQVDIYIPRCITFSDISLTLDIRQHDLKPLKS